MSDEKPFNLISGEGTYLDSQPIDLCEGHAKELDGIMGKLFGKDKAPLSKAAQDALLTRAEFLNDALDERERRIDNSYFNWER